MEPIGVNKILVEKYGYEWVNGKAWRPGTAPEPELIEEEESVIETTPEPSQSVTTPETDPVPSEPISLEEKIEQLQASINELQKKYEEALEKLEQANARIVELEGQQGETSSEGSNPDEVPIEPDETPSPDPQQPAVEEEVDASTSEAPEVSEPEPTPAPSYPEPTGVDKILVETYGYEWVNGKAWRPGTAPEPEVIQVKDQTLIGTEGDDILTGGAGNDTLEGGAGDDILDGGSGDDTYYYAYNGSDTISDTAGTDKIYLTTRDTSGERNWGDGGYHSGNDLVIASSAKSLEKLTIENAALSASAIEAITFHAADNKWADNTLKIALNGEVSDTTHLLYFGTLGNDVITAGKAYAEIYLNNGDDTARLGDGGGWVQGGNGSDTLRGGAGNDTLDGGAGNDIISGGAGADTFKFSDGFGNDKITDFEDGVDTLEYSGSVTIGSSADGYKMYTAEDGSTLTLNGVLAPNPNHHSFTSGENNFTLVSSAKSYQDAVDYASGMGGTLATFNSNTKFDGFYDAVSNVISSENLIPTTAADGGAAKYIWLGATDQLNEGTWIWENGSQMTFDNWGSGTYGSEPDNFNNQDGLALGLENWPTGSVDGAGFGDAGYWNDIDTSNELYFVVEIA